MAQIHLEIVTPGGPVVSEDVDVVTAPGSGGEFGVLANHAPFLTTIKPGTLSYKKDRDTTYLMVSGGFVEVSNNRATFLVESSEFGTAIDVERALQAKERAERRLVQVALGEEHVNRIRAEAALHRALARIQTAQRAKF